MSKDIGVAEHATGSEAIDITIDGVVQGVGFRPFVYRMAHTYHLTGWVLNALGGVEIHAEGTSSHLDAFVLALAEDAPVVAQIKEISLNEAPVQGCSDFQIVFSDDSEAEKTTLVSPDLATCEDCVHELFDPADRRYRYPFINCTNCGPRFTIIEELPYDRAHTSMAPFVMCNSCQSEYDDPLNRRFHAQPNACFECGPAIGWVLSEDVTHATPAITWAHTREESDELIAQGVAVLRQGGILAVKGLGGYHLVCDATNADALQELRHRKKREGKAFAVMVASVAQARLFCQVNSAEEQQLTSPVRPIVLLEKRADMSFASGLADDLPELGVMLPATPLQHLLVRDFGGMLVMTSGNVHDEPIVTTESDAFTKLADIADAFLVNNREIKSRYDDSVVRVLKVGEGFAGGAVRVGSIGTGFAGEGSAVESLMGGAANANPVGGGLEENPLVLQVIRRARGLAPMPLTVPLPAPVPTTACVPADELDSTSTAARAITDELELASTTACVPADELEPVSAPASQRSPLKALSAPTSLCVFATGPEQKNTFTYTRVVAPHNEFHNASHEELHEAPYEAAHKELHNESREAPHKAEAFVSQHIGDMENAETFDAWLETKTHYEQLFHLAPDVVACDFHPEYLTTKWALEQYAPQNAPQVVLEQGTPQNTPAQTVSQTIQLGAPQTVLKQDAQQNTPAPNRLVQVQHHHAHVLSVMGENNLTGPVCGIAFDGTGYGADGAIWGGEVLLANLQTYERFANFAYMPLIGGAAAIKHPERCAYGVLWAADLLEHPAAQPLMIALEDQRSTLDAMIDKGLNTPMTSSVGRLFDAASALLGICTRPRYEGEAAVLLEAALTPEMRFEPLDNTYQIALLKNTATAESTALDTSVVLMDAAPVFEAMLNDMQAGVSVSQCAKRFHDAFVNLLSNVAEIVRTMYEINVVTLSGGVFMNRYLVERSATQLQQAGFTVALNRDLPPNDASISYGQAVLALQSGY